MNSVKITHFFDVIKKEPVFEDQSDVSPVVLDPNDVKQEYHYKEELDVAWDERDNDYDENQENQNFSNDLSQKLSLPIVLIERLPDTLVNKLCAPVKNENRCKNIVKEKLHRKSYVEYYRKFCPDCNKTAAVKRNRCKNCGTSSSYECGKCKQQLPTYKDMFVHLTKKCIKEGTYYACFKCNYKSTIRYKVSAHLKRVHSILVSLNCIEGFKSENVQNVIASTTEGHKCSKCGKQFRTLPPLLRHVQLCGQENHDAPSENLGTLVNSVKDKCFHYCTKCKLTVKSGKVGNFRLKRCANCHSKFSFKCKKCNNIFQSYSTIHKHLNTVHAVTKDVLKCPECDFQTHAISYLTTHVKKKHSIKIHVCPECGGKYKNRFYFQRHSQRCRKEPLFQCDHCFYKTKRKDNMINHILGLHTVRNEISKAISF